MTCDVDSGVPAVECPEDRGIMHESIAGLPAPRGFDPVAAE